MLKKGFDIAFKDVDTKKGIVEGYFSAFNSKDAHGDVTLPGAFKKTVQERGPSGKGLIKWLMDHNPEKLLGSIQELQEDDFGLKYTGKVGRHTVAKDFLLMVEDGLINQHSIGFYIINEKFDKDAKVNYISEIKLLEGSSLQFLGANENTPVLGVKTAEDAIEMCKKLEKFIHNSEASDETLKRLYEELESLRKAIQPSLVTGEDVWEPTKAELEDIILPLFKTH